MLVTTTGVLLAWGADNRERPALPALSLRATKPKPQAPLDPWRDKLDVDRTVRQGDLTVQKLPDGTRVTYTLDPVMQKRMREYLARFELPYGAAVLYDIKSGDVLTMTGYAHGRPEVDIEQLTLTPWAPAASVFKVITGSALVQRGVPASTSVCYHGGHRGLRKHHLREIPKLDTTCRTLSDAIARSINPIMAKLSDRYLDRATLAGWSNRFGFNAPIPFDLPVTPSRADIPENRLERARVAAGFWHTEISVLHGAMIAAAVAGRGTMPAPRLIRQVVLPGGRTIEPAQRESRHVMRSSTARTMAQMMARTTTSGSGRRGFFSRRGKQYLGVDVAGKTGSLSRKSPFLAYSWFVGFAPVDKPRLAFAVLLGNPARWRIKASIAARKLLSFYYERQQELRDRVEGKRASKPVRKVAVAKVRAAKRDKHARRSKRRRRRRRRAR
ncbi:MAG: penicillin-binding protein [Myxococcales bacterium]|nr:penicillin-binding protein [Myxococcales bacterium]